MKEAWNLMQQFERVKKDLAQITVTGESGAGMIKISINGDRKVQQVVIDPGLLTADTDREMLEDLVAAAVNDAHRCLEVAIKDKFSELSGDFPLFSGMKLPL